MDYAQAFIDADQKALDFVELEYLMAKVEIDEAAAANGYRLAGYRQGRAVFTTKPPKPPREPVVARNQP